jgi:surfeit locus 1 family protein
MALTLALANWQLSRAHEKEALAARIELLAKDPPVQVAAAEVNARDVEWRQVTARGRFEPGHAVLLDNRIYRGTVGYHVVMPLAIEGGNRHVLVNRGWIAGTRERSRLPDVKTPAGAVEITGRAVTPSGRFLELAASTAEGKVWQNLTLERYRQAVPIPLQPFVIQQESPLEDGLAREWEPPDFGVNTHYSYAVQWLALALTVLVFYLVTHVRRRPQE